MNIGVNARLLLDINMEGMARYIYETTVHMAKNHPDDTFILFFDRKINPSFTFPSNVKKVIIPLQTRHPLLWYIWFEILLPFFVKKYKIDVFFSGDGYLSMNLKKPSVLVTHDLAYLHYPEHIPGPALKHYQKNIPLFHKKASSVITVSEYVKQDIIDHFHIDPDKIHVAYNAISAEPSHLGKPIPQNIQQKIGSSPYFIYVGSIHPRKNIGRLLDAFTQFNVKTNQAYKLILVGRIAWKAKEIENKISENPMVVHLGMVSESVKYQLIKDAVALMYISLFEGFGIPIIESMKIGTPVITSSVTSMPEVASDAAITVNPLDISEIADSMYKISTDEALRKTLIEKGKIRCAYFSWDKSAEIIYNEIKKSYTATFS